MAYCVNCGVKLEETLKKCPLCNTPVYPPELYVDTQKVSPYPTKRGTVEKAKRKDVAILLGVLFGSTALGCGLLNMFVYTTGLWSLYVIAACVVCLIFSLPILLYRRLPYSVMIFLDGLAVLLYTFVVAAVNDGMAWFYELAIPIILLATALIISSIQIMQRISHSILSRAMIFVIDIAVFCVGVNLCTSHYWKGEFEMTWSAIVAVCATIVSVSLVTIMRITRLREEVRRRMHI